FFAQTERNAVGEAVRRFRHPAVPRARHAPNGGVIVVPHSFESARSEDAEAAVIVGLGSGELTNPPRSKSRPIDVARQALERSTSTNAIRTAAVVAGEESIANAHLLFAELGPDRVAIGAL